MPAHIPDHRPAAKGATPGRYGTHVTRAAWPDPLFLDDLAVVLRLPDDPAAQAWLVRERVPTLRLGGRLAVRRATLAAVLAEREVARG